MSVVLRCLKMYIVLQVAVCAYIVSEPSSVNQGISKAAFLEQSVYDRYNKFGVNEGCHITVIEGCYHGTLVTRHRTQSWEQQQLGHEVVHHTDSQSRVTEC